MVGQSFQGCVAVHGKLLGISETNLSIRALFRKLAGLQRYL